MNAAAQGLLFEDNPEPRGGAKALGAFYTDAQIADFLVWWAVRSPEDRVLDPCFGGGVFLRSACKRLQELGGQAATQVRGVEIDPEVHARIADKLAGEFGVNRQHLELEDFFRLDPGSDRQVDVVIGNPPFIRYQRFTGPARARALARSSAEGVHFPELCSSWAPFLIHCTAMIRRAGRLAMVVPMELAHARYARPVLAHLRRTFGRVTFLTFQTKLFPDLSENTLLVLAEARGLACSAFLCRDLPHAGVLTELRQRDRRPLGGTRRLDPDELAAGQGRLVEYLIPTRARELYRALKLSGPVRRLGQIADVGIGYVTGANDFFHLQPGEARRRRLPDQFLRPAVRRGRALAGLRFTIDDWRKAAREGEAGYLLAIDRTEDLPESVRDYLRDGEALGVPRAYKCRTRSPWFRVPHVYQPDAFLTYMSGITPRLVTNDAGAVAPNTLHVVRLRPDTDLSGRRLAALWQTSLTRLSVEIEGHPLGGGMLKLEPTEAENVLVPLPPERSGLDGLADELDSALRRQEDISTQVRADMLILREGLGLSRSDCDLLRRAAATLRSRRYGRSVPA
jgi:adenine-specific DNA methylase